MSYLGIKVEGQVPRDLRQRAERRNVKLRAPLGADSHVRLILERPEHVQVGRRDKAFCLVDVPSSATAPSSRKGKTDLPHTKTLVRAWDEQGTDVLSRWNVTASLALWKGSSDRLVLVRAENGVPPIFFAERPHALLWSDEIKTLLRYGVEPKLNHRSLDAYFSLGYVPSPWTLFKGIRKVPAGQFCNWHQGDRTVGRHHPPIPQSRTVRDLDASSTELKKRLCRSLNDIVDEYDRIGVLLSSGVDSAFLVGLLHCELGARVEAFTFEYSDYDGRYNEYGQARRLTRAYDIPHHKIEYSGEWLRTNLREATLQYEEPFTFGHHTARLGPVKKKGVPILLNGILPESEFFSRTATYALRVGNPVARSIAEKSQGLFQSWPFDRLSRLKHAVDLIGASPGEVFYNIPDNTVLPDPLRKRLYTEPGRVEEGRKALLDLFEGELDRADLSTKPEQVSHLRNTYFVSDHLLWWNYRWANAHGIKMGAPYTLPQVSSWLQSIQQPLWPPYQASIRKILIRRAADTILPDGMAYNQKIAQTAPFWVWFRGALRPLLNAHLSPDSLEDNGLFETDFVRRELKHHINGTGRRPYIIWSLLCFMVWKEAFLESGDFA